MNEHKHKNNEKYHHGTANICRVCKHFLEEGEARSNDYYTMHVMPKDVQDEYADTIKQPICHYCAEDPDEFHTEFLRRFAKAEYKAKLNKILNNLL